ncbi:MAG: DinB family protein [Ferruginibacter sp.]|nr:DinB family protein [Cytophagales bacterium]
MHTLIAQFERTIHEFHDQLARITEAESEPPLSPGKWSRKQVIGHLIDSAANNHQRFVRLQLGTNLSLPGYEQDGWVARQDYQHRSWTDLLLLWQSYNLHLLHVVARIPEDKLGNVGSVGGGESVTLGFLVEDYVRHLKHHLGQILG